MAVKSNDNKGTNKRNTKASSNVKSHNNKNEHIFIEECIGIGILGLSLLLIISNFGGAGFVGKFLSSLVFGVFGMWGHIFPVYLLVVSVYAYAFRKNKKTFKKVIASMVVLLCLCAISQLFSGTFKGEESIASCYKQGSEFHTGGGFLGGIIALSMYPALGAVGSMLVILIASILALVIITEKSFIDLVKVQGERAAQEVSKKHKASSQNRRIRRDEQHLNKISMREEREYLQNNEKEDNTAPVSNENFHQSHDHYRNMQEQVVRGVTFDTTLSPQNSKKQVLFGEEKTGTELNEVEAFHVNYQDAVWMGQVEKQEDYQSENNLYIEEHNNEHTKMTKKESVQVKEEEIATISHNIEQHKEQESSYKLPPLSLLNSATDKKEGGDLELRQTAMKLEEVLHSFGVKVKVTEYSKGPSVTRYELQPEKGVKVSKIVGLVDDIKLNLAAADIRIEAPIPGKAAVGIEVPNRETSMVSLRSLLESPLFQKHESNLAFAAGKDIAGQPVVTDIAKMPHVLIAGSTGSGKSVCINTLIMSILFKASPDDVKLIMIDPKVVELSVYNGIPHLLIPVVTDPKKAAGALHWAVTEMTKRYQLFAQYNVRDLKGYNEKIKTIEHIEDETKPEKMPHIVVIVDELADLMMVAPGDVEEAICRLAQLARAAGIHLILATQRPSVNVITGLIKANMPSRIAFAVSSGVDSRTIIDMNGAEKLLGKGDMLFYPTGFPKPARVQGAFVSDKEVQKVVQYLIEQEGETQYSPDIEKEVSSSASNMGATMPGAGASGEELDPYFVDAGKFIIEKDKASIGMLQRNFKVGFNRAARIMDQLADAGVVGEEEGTKPRKVLMSITQFEQYIEEYV